MRFYRVSALALLSILLGPATGSFAHEGAQNAAAKDGEAEDGALQPIRESARKFTEAFDRGDAQAVAELWTEDGEYVDGTGSAYRGRSEIQKAYADFFAAHPEARLRLDIESVRMLSGNAAIEDGKAVLATADGDASKSSSYSVVHVKVDGRWLMASVRDGADDDEPTREHLADLEWLIGDWIAEEHGVTTTSQCRWICEKGFVERKYTTKGGATETSGVQIIGWNAESGHVQSWSFSADGGFAVGIWSPIEGGWQAEVTGVTRDGAATGAVNRLQRLDDNAYAWQSVQRSLGEASLPDTGEVVIRRVSAE